MATKNEQQSSGQIILPIDISSDNVTEWRSNAEMIGGFKWCVKGRKKIEEQLLISICCNEDCCLNQLWLAKVDYSLESPNIQNDVSMKDIYFFNGCERKHTIKMVLSATERHMNLILTLKVIQSSSYTKIMALDTVLRFSFPVKSDNKDEENKDMERVITVNKHSLASISNNFDNLFFGNWSERSNSNSFVIKEEANFSSKAFAIMVYSSMAMGCMIHESGILHNGKKEKLAMEILKLSIKYDMPVMQNNCEKHLIQSEKCPKMELFLLAEQLGLQKLIEHVLRTITPFDIGEDFGRDAAIRAHLNEQTGNELDKRLMEKTKEMRTVIEETKKNSKCYNCGGRGHWASECPSPSS